RDDRATDRRSVRARAWPHHPDGASQARLQPGGLLHARRGDRRRRRRSDPGAAPLGPSGIRRPGRRAGGPDPHRRAGGARAPAPRARPAANLSTVLELVAGILLATGAVYFVLRPILYPEVEGRGTGNEGRGDEGEDPEDDLSPRAVALRALKEIEFDRATGELSDADYDVLKTRYTSEALAALRAEPSRSEMRDAGSGASAAASPPASRLPHPVCPNHGPRPE